MKPRFDRRLELARRRMVERLARAGLRDGRVLRAMAAVPRELLVAEALRGRAYREDESLPIGVGQTISAPRTVAVMSAAAELGPDDRVLEIGTGSGYQAAILALLARRVDTVECVPELSRRAREALTDFGLGNVSFHVGDGSLGHPGAAPYDAILVTAGGPRIPAPLLEQLARGGRLVGPFGSRDGQVLVRVRRARDGRYHREVLGRCRFVDLVGANGWAA